MRADAKISTTDSREEVIGGGKKNTSKIKKKYKSVEIVGRRIFSKDENI